jgi:hypothetical protein
MKLPFHECKLGNSAILGLLIFSFHIHSKSADFSLLSTIATQTRDICQPKINEDTIEFEKCIQKIAQDASKEKNAKTYRLAIYYYGWLASVVAAKNGVPSSEETARYFLPKFRKIQKDIKISDLDLCHTIPGDCTSRNARMVQMEEDKLGDARPTFYRWYRGN